jgi:hypothetical protein
MAVSLYYGMTESGKTFLASKAVQKFERSIIFDFTGKINIHGAFITSDFSPVSMLKLFTRFKDYKKFVIIFRPGRIRDAKPFFNKVAMFALALGRQAVKRGQTDRLILLIDEADFICSSDYQSQELKEVVNVGRHDLVDSWFIARIPQRLHVDARANATKIFCFKLTDDSALKYIKNAIGQKAVEKIRVLEKYSFLAWKDTGEIYIFDKNDNQIESWS